MPSCSPNTTVSAASFAASQVLLNATGAAIGVVAGTDAMRRAYSVHNRDAAIYVRVAVAEMDIVGNLVWLNSGGEGGAAVAPGETVLFGSKLGRLVLVRVWAESGSPIIDGRSNAA